MYKCQVEHCTYRTTFFYFFKLHYVSCSFVSVDWHTVSASRPLPFLPLTSLTHFKPRIGGEPTFYGLHQSPTNHYSNKFQSIHQERQKVFLKFADILSSITLKTGDATVNDLVRIMHSGNSNIDLLKSTIKHATNCKEMVQPYVEKIMKENVFQV